jgi:HlyD family secretion protein
MTRAPAAGSIRGREGSRRSRSRALVALALAAAAILAACGDEEPRMTGYVEGEERILRSEVAGRIRTVPHAEGEDVAAGDTVAELDASDVDAKIATKRAEIAMLDGEIRVQDERIALTESTWRADVKARAADLERTNSALDLAERTYGRQSGLRKSGTSSAEAFDQARSQRDQARSTQLQAQEVLARTEAEVHSLELARQQLGVLKQRRVMSEAQLAELEVLRAKYTIRAPDVGTVVQTQLAWPGELAQPGTPIVSVLDPRDKYVQVYVPVPWLAEARIGRRVEVELDGLPGKRFPGEISFVADEASFTPEKIETREDRVGQVYRAKVRILEGAEELRPGTEGNVYLVADRADETVSTAAR